MEIRHDPVTVQVERNAICHCVLQRGKAHIRDDTKSGELLTIGIGMILTVDRKHNFFMSFCVRMYGVFILRAIFLPENQLPVGDFPCY